MKSLEKLKMPYKYKIDTYQLTKKTTYSGEMDSLNEVSVILKQVEKKLVKDETARITFTYAEINEKKLSNLDREKG